MSSPSGAAARESVFLQSYRAEFAHFIAVVNEDTPYEPPDDADVVVDTGTTSLPDAVAAVLARAYDAADGRDVRLGGGVSDGLNVSA